MAAREDQPQPVVDRRPSRRLLLARRPPIAASIAASRCELLGLLGQPSRRRRMPVDRRVAGGRRDPGAGLRGTPWRGQVSSAFANASWTASSARSKSPSDPDQGRDRPARFLAEQAVDGLVRGGLGQARRSGDASCAGSWPASKSTIGRTSIEPHFAPGQAPPSASASSRSFASMR